MVVVLGEVVGHAGDAGVDVRAAQLLRWPLLAAEVAVFLPWTWYQLYGNGGVPAAERSVFAWGLLVAMTAIGALALVLAQRWAARDAADLESLRSELMDGDAESSSPTEP